ncbi:uncharacterized protein LOC127851365 [Dreissena polymorpha]|uniref:Uncharacterized protein n=1 Tax=Dreissena polymorpha TaxID=45954 RepID=A0A9D4HXI6_DREPO|nr:uncharacterized protein LOC127851365 [Dreissena polymorpha]KAH3736418.1 hypothetical protein DPMN_042981 [Dreissena polymorpha]
MLKKWDKLAELLELVKDSVATHDTLKVIFSTSTQVPEITNGLVVVKVPVLPIEHISSLITNVCVSKQVNVDESQKLYIPLIGTLCDGIPYIATTAGSILSENQGLILPSELLELMIAQRLEVLSPTNYPTSNRFVALTGPISESSLNIEVRDFLSNLAQKLRSTFTEDEAVQCNDDTRDTAAMVKNSKLRPLLICCILAKDKKLCLPTVFKECKLVVDKNLAQENHGENAEEVKRLEDCRLNLTRENLTRLNLTITDRQLENPKEVEKIIKSLMDTAKREPEENFDSFGSKILEELGLDCNFFGIPDVQTPDGKPEPTVAYGGSGSGLEFVQLRKDAFRKEFFGNDTSSLGSLNYDQFSYAYKDLSENHINMKSDDIVSQKDLLSNGPHALDVDPDYKGNETLESIHSESYTCKKETVALYDHDINKILLLNDNKNTPKVRGEQMPLQSSGPNGIMYVNNAAEEIKLHPQISEEDSGIEHGSDVHMRRTTD